MFLLFEDVPLELQVQTLTEYVIRLLTREVVEGFKLKQKKRSYKIELTRGMLLKCSIR